jgi:hypothetical protein
VLLVLYFKKSKVLFFPTGLLKVKVIVAQKGRPM